MPAHRLSTPSSRSAGKGGDILGHFGDRSAAGCRTHDTAHARHEIEPSEIVRESALRFLRVHPLRAADALQLAAAFTASERRPASLQVVTLDERLADAARKEGFTLVDIAAA
jgi:hypothetical protein